MQERDIKVIKEMNIQSTSFEIDHVEINGTDFIRYRSRVGNEFNIQDDLQIKSQFTRKYCNTIGDKHYLFQYVEGKLLKDYPKCSEHMIWKFVQQILTGLFDLHKNKSIGRCFNVQNILVTNKENILLMEFGYYPDINFVLPEFEQSKKYNYEADLFLLGLVIYFLMTGSELQYNHMNYTSQLEFQLQKIQNLQYSEQLKQIVKSCLDINPQKRCRPEQIFNCMDQSPLQLIIEKFYKDDINKSIYAEIEQKIQKREKLSSQIMFSMRIPQKLESRIVQQTAETLESNSQLLPPEEDNVDKVVSQFQLDYVNYYHKEDHVIWFKLNLLQYRFKFLNDLSEYLDSFDKNLTINLPTTIYALKKMRLIYMGQFLQKLELKENIVGVSQNQWNEFKKTSQGLEKMYNQFKALYNTDREMLKLDLNSLQQTLKQFYPDRHTDTYFPQYESFLDLQINCSFDDVKIKYRLPLNLFFNFVDQTIQKSKDTPKLLPIYKQIKLRLLIAITINRSLDPEFVFNSYKVAARFQGIDRVSNPEQIYKFLQFGDEQAFDDQIQEIHAQIFT